MSCALALRASLSLLLSPCLAVWAADPKPLPPVPPAAPAAPAAPVPPAASIQDPAEVSASERLGRADDALNEVFARLLKRLPAPGQKLLRAEERRWINERDAAAAAYRKEGLSEKASRLEGLAIATEARLAVLQKRLGSSASPTISARNFSGHYELARSKAPYSFELDVTQNATSATIEFAAGQNNGGGAAPGADGEGQLNGAGALVFTFKDTFDNEGTATLTRKDSNLYRLKIEITKVEEPRCLRLYGDLLLRRSGPPKPSEAPPLKEPIPSPKTLQAPMP